MEPFLSPFLIYYWGFGMLLPYWQWVVVTGLAFIALAKAYYEWLKCKLSSLPTFVRWLGATTAVTGVVGSMPTNFLYGAIAGEAGRNFGRLIDEVVWLPWPIFRILIGLSSGIISVLALLVLAVVIWGGLGVICAWAMIFVASMFKQNE